MRKSLFLLTATIIFFISCQKPEAPKPMSVVPSERQLAWHDLQFYAFVHFNMNTFSNMEWGFGNEKPEMFNPTELDCRQWAKVCKDAGMKGIIITAKHHDGFCLWPSKYTEHSVKNSPWKDGKGDVVGELAEACKEFGLKFGIYLSPWDRNHAEYSTPEYIEYFRNQLRELLTNYGEVFEVWFDGANGGTGYYGGANERRNVDRKTYYDWENTYKIVRELQPNAMLFSDAGPDCRWCGNEEGWVDRTNWCTLRRDEFWPGSPNYKQLRVGHEDGTHWVPAEIDVSIRPGWYYHPYEDHKVKTLPQLLDIYYHSIGRGGNFLLNFPVDKRGLIHENDVEQVMKLAEQIKKDFKTELAGGMPVKATEIRGRGYGAKNTVDGKPDTYWATSDGVTKASLEIDLGAPTEFNRLLIQEYIPLGQRVQQFSVEALVDGEWNAMAWETTIGYKRILRLPTVKATKVKVTIEEAKACPLISNIEIYNAPKVLVEPTITRNKEGYVKITTPELESKIYYTTNSLRPTVVSKPYEGEFALPLGGVVKAIVADLNSGRTSPIKMVKFDLSAKNWSVVKPSGDEDSDLIFDGNDKTAWGIKVKKLPADVVIDLGSEMPIKGFTYTPDQGRYINGIATSYAFYVSRDGKSWGVPVSKGEFPNIQNSPVKQEKSFEKTKARYIKFSALSTVEDQKSFRMAEFSVITR